MQKYFDSVFGDALGLRPIAGASVTVRLPNGDLASLFSDNGITPKANPVVTDSTGYFDFYAVDGKYNLTITATGFTTQIRNDVILEDPAEASAGTFTTVTVAGNSTLGGPTTTTTIGGAGVVTNGFSVLAGTASVNGNAVISTSSANPALRITQTGTGEALRVEDEANPDASPFVIDAAGNVGVGTATPNAKFESVGATARISNDSTAATNTALAIGSYSLSSANVYGANLRVYHNFAVNGQSDLAFELNGTTEMMRLNSAGNLGLRVTPSVWDANYRVFQIGGQFALTGFNGNLTWLSTNWRQQSGVERYITNGFATIYRQADGSHAFFTAPSGTAGAAITFTQAMTLTSGGNLLVGRTFEKSYPGFNYVAIHGPTGALLDFHASSVGAGDNRVAQIFASSSGLGFATGPNDAIVERARITSAGYFKASNAGDYLNASGAYHELRSNRADWITYTTNSSANPFGTYFRFTNSAPNSTTNEFWYCDDSSSTQRASLRSNGGFANFQANNVNLSDRREKTNFAPAKSYLDVICAIPVQTFNYIDQNLEDDPGLTLGVVAQDVQAVAPELVMESNWGTKEEPKMRLSIYQTDLQYALMKCIQEQQTMIAALESRLAALEQK